MNTVNWLKVSLLFLILIYISAVVYLGYQLIEAKLIWQKVILFIGILFVLRQLLHDIIIAGIVRFMENV